MRTLVTAEAPIGLYQLAGKLNPINLLCMWLEGIIDFSVTILPSCNMQIQCEQEMLVNGGLMHVSVRLQYYCGILRSIYSASE